MNGEAVAQPSSERAPTERPLVEVRGLAMHFPISEGIVMTRKIGDVKAVDGVDFSIARGETLGLVGESGCGKTTTGRCILRLETPTAGEILFDGRDVTRMERRDLLLLRRRMQVIFQDPYSSLNPRMKVGDIIAEPIKVHGVEPDARRRRDKVRELLSVCGLDPKFADRYPHEMSGGQRQRVGIARALALDPEFIVCDEAVSALDVSVKAQIVNLLQDLQKELGLALLFISHDLAIVEHMTHRVAVMYLGKIVELGVKRQIFAAPKHPYTQALLSAVPVPEPGASRQRIILQGDVPSPINPPSGCRFHTRCPYVFDRCRTEEPPLRPTMTGHFAACHLHDLPAAQNPLATAA